MCRNCNNTKEHESIVRQTVEQIKQRNPDVGPPPPPKSRCAVAVCAVNFCEAPTLGEKECSVKTKTPKLKRIETQCVKDTKGNCLSKVIVRMDQRVMDVKWMAGK
jgi:hypothetical protein